MKARLLSNVRFIFALTFLFSMFWQTACQQSSASDITNEDASVEHSELIEDDLEFLDFQVSEKAVCSKANSSQIAVLNQGNSKKEKFLSACADETNRSPWCEQLIRPNPSSKSSFQCTYGANQVHQLIHPDENTWENAFQAVRLVERLEQNNVKVCLIYNWWRPEPYNKNVGGAAGRHPYGTSVDVRLCSKNDQSKAHSLLCKWRKQGELRALGYYSSTALHFGVGDNIANTWGKSCP